MISNIRDRYKDASIAILGSGPSIFLYEEREDITIATNGASLIEKKYDIFIAGDRKAPERDWWLASKDKPKDLVMRIVSSYIAPFDPFLYPEEDIRLKLQEELKIFSEEHKYEDCPYCFYIPKIKPKEPHLFFRFGGFGEEFVKKISPDQEVIYWGGTISAIALQLSLVMGVKEVNIYGCGFDNDSGVNYYYECPNSQRGKISEKQLRIMKLTIDKVRDFEVFVKIHGKSNLK